MIATLVLVCVIAGFGLAFTYAATKDQIAKQKKIDEAKAYTAVLPSVTNANDFKPMDDVVEKASKKSPELLNVVAAEPKGKLVGYVIVSAPRGYGGPVQLVVGLTPDGSITNIAPITGGNNETMGLGSQALVPGYLKQYKGKPATSTFEFGKGIDAVSGATRSSTAVLNAARISSTVFLTYLRR